MANISFFFPASQKGVALGLNAGLGNLGVSAAQFVVPLVIVGSLFGAISGAPQVWSGHGEARQIWLQNAGFVWVPAIAMATLAAWFGMNDIPGARASFSEQAVIFVRKHNWLMSWLYLGTFGSFIGHAAGFPLLLQTAFPAVEATQYVFVGPLVGALMRPLGGCSSLQPLKISREFGLRKSVNSFPSTPSGSATENNLSYNLTSASNACFAETQ